jgi:O-acetyl-ADP-ribose deacetylase
LHRHHLPDFVVDAVSPGFALCWRRARIDTIAFPAISCGAYRYPIADAAEIAVSETRKFLTNSKAIEKVIFVLASDEILAAYRKLL